MKRILVTESESDIALVRDMIDQQSLCECGKRKRNTSPEEVVLVPNPDLTHGCSAQWTVVDNRDHQCFTEDFRTLDGALIYAADLRQTTERQHTWDVNGEARKELLERIGAGTSAEAGALTSGRRVQSPRRMTVRDLLSVVRGRVTLTVLVYKGDAKDGKEVSWRTESEKGGMDLMSMIMESSCLNSAAILSSPAEIGAPMGSPAGWRTNITARMSEEVCV